MKLYKYFIGILLVSLFPSCGTINFRYHYFDDAKKLSSENVAILGYEENITIYKANGKKVSWNTTTGDKVIYLPQGEYIFQVRYGAESYRNGTRVWNYTDKIDIGPITLEGGKQYKLAAISILDKVNFSITPSLIPLNEKSRLSISL
jgi:hypothetical protein